MPSVNTIKTTAPDLPLNTSVKPSFQEISKEEFDQFEDAIEIWTNQADFSNQESISSCEMDDCITIFGIERLDNRIIGISAYHVSSFTEQKEMILEYFQYFSPTDTLSFFLIGGNSGNDAYENLLTTIRNTIHEYFENSAHIEAELTGINDGYRGKFSSANLQMDGTISYYFHS